ncbi:MAG: arabinosyltransferase domain-containing protein [Candidatus Rokubacteria bacterium]|nr:arabinosyltransferase domain-containing protein [Candidatus Rokubacteria bacterium]
MAFRVAPSRSCLWTQESWFLTFTISRRKGFRPARARTLRKIASWVLGEQAVTTTRLIPFARIASSISCWVLPAQEYI